MRYDDVDLADNDFLPSTKIVALHPEDKSNEVVLTMVFIKGGGGNRSGTNSLSLYWLFHLEEVWQFNCEKTCSSKLVSTSIIYLSSLLSLFLLLLLGTTSYSLL